MTQTDSPYFKIISPHDVGHKVAPGMDTVFIIQFTPDEKKVLSGVLYSFDSFVNWKTLYSTLGLALFFQQDYTHELICITEREKFLVPVKAIGARAILDFPDEISFGTCPVKVYGWRILVVVS